MSLGLDSVVPYRSSGRHPQLVHNACSRATVLGPPVHEHHIVCVAVREVMRCVQSYSVTVLQVVVRKHYPQTVHVRERSLETVAVDYLVLPVPIWDLIVGGGAVCMREGVVRLVVIKVLEEERVVCRLYCCDHSWCEARVAQLAQEPPLLDSVSDVINTHVACTTRIAE